MDERKGYNPDLLPEVPQNPEGLKYHGDDSSLEIFPHLNLSWRKLQHMAEGSKKPIGDLGASFSTLSVEGKLRDINIIPVDIMDIDTKAYQQKIWHRMQSGALGDLYQGQHTSPQILQREDIKMPVKDFLPRLRAAVKEAAVNYVKADLAHLPFADRALSVAIAHDSVPKHSLNLDTFVAHHLPEILRVTDKAAYIYPMALYKEIPYEQGYDKEYDERVWQKVEQPDPWKLRHGQYKLSLEEVENLLDDDENREKIIAAAANSGFDFRTEPHFYSEPGHIYTPRRSDDHKLGIFTRRE